MGDFYDAEEDFETTKERRLSPAASEKTIPSFRNIGASTQNGALSDDETSSSDETTQSTSSPRIRDKARRLGRKTKSKTKDLLGLKPDTTDSNVPTIKVAQAVEGDPAFNPAQLTDDSPTRIKRKATLDVKEIGSGLLSATAHPIRTTREGFKRSAAKKISSQAQRPFLSAEDDRELLDAHDELQSSRSHTSGHTSSDTDYDEIAEKQERMHIIEDHRESLRIAWSVGRHIDRVRIVERHKLAYPRKKDFYEKCEGGKMTRWNWEQYVGQLALYFTRGFTAQYIDDFEQLPFDMDTITRTIERVVLASEPWQAYYMNLRQLYRWEDPRRTGFWLVVWILLWQFKHIGTFLYGYVVFIVLKERFFPGSVENVRQSLDRAVNRSQTAHAWGEVIDQHGNKEWIEPLLEEFGPPVQLMLGDLADYLETLINFYHWRRPDKTAASVFFYFCCFLLCLFGNMAFCMQVVYFVAIGWFFLCFPMCSRIPKYRYLFDPLRWIYWDIPTHAELSLWDLRKRAVLRQMEVDRATGGMDGHANGNGENIVHTGSSARQTNTESFKFRVISSGKVGRLHICRTSIRFTRGRQTLWEIPHSQLIEMRKEEAQKGTKMISLGQARHKIVLGYCNEVGEEEERSIDSDGAIRDEMFSIVLGWSGLHWKPVRMANRSKGAKI